MIKVSSVNVTIELNGEYRVIIVGLLAAWDFVSGQVHTNLDTQTYWNSSVHEGMISVGNL